MTTTKQMFLYGGLASVIAMFLVAGCGTKNDSISQAEKTEKNRPSIAETKAIAEEGFIYGLPLVMNYTANYEFFVDKTSKQYKGSFNQLISERRVFTYKDTAVVTPNSDTPYSFTGLDLRAEPYVISVPAVEKNAITHCSSLTGTPSTTATSEAVRQTTMPAITSSSAQTGRARRPQASRACCARLRSSRSSSSAHSSSGRTTCRMS